MDGGAAKPLISTAVSSIPRLGKKIVQRKKKVAVLVGCNYPNTQFKLHGCINDVKSMKKVLEEKLEFDPSHIELLTDVPVPGSSGLMPTGANIKAALHKMVNNAEEGDVMFFHFSGHGTTIPVLEPGQPFREDEAIVPCDLNLITDVDFRHLVNRVPKGASFTILSDSCHSGGLIDKEKEQIGYSYVKTSDIPSKPSNIFHRDRSILFNTIHEVINGVSKVAHTGVDFAESIAGFFGKEVSLKFHPQQHIRYLLNVGPLKEDGGILLSGCQTNEISADLVENGGTAYGAFTHAVVKVLQENDDSEDLLTNKKLVMKARKILEDQGFLQQHPCLYSSDGNAKLPFLGHPTTYPDA